MTFGKPFRDWPIRRKLTSLFLLAGCITAMAVCVPMGLFDFLGLRQAMAQDLGTLADVLSRNSTAAVSFRDAKSAREVLEALRAQPNVTAACIYSGEGKPFATYIRPGSNSTFVPPSQQREITRFDRNRLFVFRRIMAENEQIGTIYIESDLQKQYSRMRAMSAAFLLTLAIALSLSILLASRLQKPISRPLLHLVETAKAISDAGDYSPGWKPGMSLAFFPPSSTGCWTRSSSRTTSFASIANTWKTRSGLELQNSSRPISNSNCMPPRWNLLPTPS